MRRFLVVAGLSTWKEWIDIAIYLGLLMALYAVVGTQPLGKAALVGGICAAMRQSYHWSQR